MSQEKINLLLNKIQTIIGPSGAISDLEKDLIKGYMRELYVLVDSLSSVDTGTTISSTPMPILEAPKAVDESMPRERLHQANEPTFAFEEHQDDFDDKAYKEDPSHPQVPKLEKDNGSTHSKPEMAPREVVSDDSLSEVIATKDVTPTDYQELFALEHAKDLSQKLSRQPIRDLQKAFSINDRLLVTAKLFEGSSEDFLDTLDILNTKHSFKEAKNYLIRYVIDKFKWLDEGKKDQARDFINLVARRYLD